MGAHPLPRRRGAKQKAQAKGSAPLVVRLDELDAKILALLQQDARLSFREIAERIGSTTPTVSARIKALEDIGLLQGYRAQLDHTILGGTSYVLTLTLQPQATRAAFLRVQTMPGVHSAHLLPGGRIVAHIHLRPPAFGLAELDAAVAELAGLITYDASQVIEGHEHPPIVDLPENVDVACHQCKGPIHGEPVKGKMGDRTHVFCCRQCLGTFRARFEELQHAAASPQAKLRAKGEAPAPPHRSHHHQ